MAVKMHRLMLHASFCLLFVTANAEDCSTEGNVRLVSADGVAENEGRVEVCVNGVWGTVCDDRWGASDARVVCHQLGLVADYADAIYRYNPGSGPIHFSGFHCFGNENRLFDCAIEQNSKNVTLCGHNQDAGVRCPRVPCRDNDVRLNGGNIVQVCFNQQWGLVCEHLYSWSSIDAGVVCDQVGIHSQLPRAARRPRQPYDASVVLSGVRCTGSETRLTNCSVMQRDDFDACEYVAVAQCEVKESCEVPNSIRLTTTWFRNRTIGRLEMCSGNVWGTVCGNGAARAIAVVACRELNHAANGTLFLERILSFVPPLIPITRTNMVCSGNETNLANCSFDGVYGDANCQHRDDLFITCMARQCTENNIRLRGGHENYYGRVEICLHGLWGTVCGDRWDSREAAVVCRQLHLYGSSYTLKSFPNPDGLPIHLDNVNCQGNESMLNECSHPGIGNENCAEGYEEAGVICTDVMCEDGAVHLVGGSDISRGRVEFCYRGKWYTVCASTWRDSGYEARVVCKTLDYNVFRYGEFISNFGRGFSPILPYQIKCGVDDLSLKQCTKTGFDTSECEHVAGVICGADCQSSGITDCTVCGDRVGCHTQYNCNCHSRCYEFGDCCPDVSTLKNCVVKECESGEIRLVGGLTNSVGRLELCANGIWGRVCNRLQYWGPVNAKVVCRQLGFSEVGAYVVDNATLFGESERNAVVGEVHCTGDEPELLECSHTDIGRHLCGSQFNPVPDIAISCYDEVSSCEEGEMRLSKNSSGHVEYCQHRTWGAVCSEGWDDIDAGVACSQLGFNPADAIAKGNFSLAESIPIFLSQVECNGSEIGLKDCVKTMPNARCEFAAGVMCKRSSPNSGAEKGAEKGVAVAGSVIGGVLGSIIVIVLIIGVLLRYRKFKIQERNQFLNYQLGILTRPQSGGTNRPQQEHTTQTYDDGINCSLGVKPDENPQMVSSEKHIPMAAESSTSDNNCYANNQPSCHQSVSRTRVYSHHLRELTRGKFIVKKADITLLEIIGEGEFGIVYKARLGVMRNSRVVAVKTLKGDFDQEEIDRFVEESLKMSRFKHAHVMGLIGVCPDEDSAPFIIMPYMANGSLLKYLKNERDNIVLSEENDTDEIKDVCKRLLMMCNQIASGMEYLAAGKYVHRDLAARNCMIDTHFLIKITDFGLSEDVFLRNYYRQAKSEDTVRLPVKWMAPESLADGHFSEKSDVWSYGVTMWEIFSGGKVPYPGTTPLSVIQSVEEGHRMSKPCNAACNEEIYSLMVKCWEKSPKDRPSFSEIYKEVTKFIERAAGYLDISFNPFTND